MKTTKIYSLVIAFIGLLAFSFNAVEIGGAYSIDAGSSVVKWVGKKVTGQHNGSISLSKGTFDIKKGKLKGGVFFIDMTSITCEDLADANWNAKLIGHLKSDDFFSVEKFNTAKFEITKANSKGGDDYQITGKLTIKGITNEISFPAKVSIDGSGLSAKAKVVVDRTKWNIRYGSGSFFSDLGDKTIDDNFELDLNITAKK